MNAEFLPAYNGDCILLNFEDRKGAFNVLIDGGIARTYPQYLKKTLLNIKEKGQNLDLLIITHIDDDHIGGIIKLFEDSTIDKSIIKKVWFNSGEIISKYFNTATEEKRNVKIIPDSTLEMSVKDGVTLESELKRSNLFSEEIIKNGYKYSIGETSIVVLSPNIDSLNDLNKKWSKETYKQTNMSNKTANKYNIPLKKIKTEPFKEDKSIPNRSSIAILLESGDKKLLFLADSCQFSIISSLRELGYSEKNPILLDLVKLSHHGSKKNTGVDLLKMIKCRNYVITTDGSSHNLPNKEVFARILKVHPNSTFSFNYKNENILSIFSKDDLADFQFVCNYLEDKDYKMVL